MPKEEIVIVFMTLALVLSITFNIYVQLIIRFDLHINLNIVHFSKGSIDLCAGQLRQWKFEIIVQVRESEVIAQVGSVDEMNPTFLVPSSTLDRLVVTTC